MGLAIVPAKVSLLPQGSAADDFQLFQAVSTPGPALWVSPTNGVIQSDLSILSSNEALDCNGESAQQLLVSPGFLEFVMTNDCLPTGGLAGGYVQVDVVHYGGAQDWLIRIHSDQIRLSQNLGAVYQTITTTAAVGDKYRVVIDGQRHLYKNGVLIAETQPPAITSDPTGFPVIKFTVLLHPPIAGTDRIPPITLGGNWALREGIVTWTAPVEGTFTTGLPGNRASLTAAARAGEYFARVQIASSAFEQFDNSISIPPLTIIGPSAVTLDPGQKVRFRTNYDDAKTDIVTWSVVSGGGSFDAAHVYTAATAPGNSTIRAAFAPQQKDIVVTVRSVITPDYPAVEPSEVVDWDTNITTPTFTATAGSINSGTGVWTAPAILGQTVKIGASGGGFSVARDVVIASKFPYDPTAVIPVDYTKKALISESEDGTRAARVKNKAGNPQRKLELTFRNRDLTELEAVIAFWQANYPSRPFIFIDKVRNKRVVAYFASDLHYDVGATCDIDYSFRIIEKA